MVKVPHLTAIASGLAMATGCMILVAKKEIDKKTNQATFLKTAIGIMEDQPAVKAMLGDEYVVGRGSVLDGYTKLQQKNVRIMVPIRGVNDTAFLFAHARRKETNELYKLYKLEMTFAKFEGKKLVLLDLDDVSDVDDLLKGVETKPAESVAEK